MVASKPRRAEDGYRRSTAAKFSLTRLRASRRPARPAFILAQFAGTLTAAGSETLR
jgi:hypothetical protein